MADGRSVCSCKVYTGTPCASHTIQLLAPKKIKFEMYATYDIGTIKARRQVAGVDDNFVLELHDALCELQDSVRRQWKFVHNGKALMVNQQEIASGGWLALSERHSCGYVLTPFMDLFNSLLLLLHWHGTMLGQSQVSDPTRKVSPYQWYLSWYMRVKTILQPLSSTISDFDNLPCCPGPSGS